VAPGLLLYAFDRVLRMAKGGRAYTHLAVCPCDGVTKVSFACCPPFHFRPGQYCFVNVPAISVLEWHPFTLSSAPADAHTTVHIKEMGEGTFTAKLNKLAANVEKQQAKQGRQGRQAGEAAEGAGAASGIELAGESSSGPELAANVALQVRVDGPYGEPPRIEEYDKLLLVCGGIGVTPCHSLLRHWYLSAVKAAKIGTLSQHPRRVELLWSLRDASMPQLFGETLRAIDANSLDGRFAYTLFLTSAGRGNAALSAEEGGFAFTKGRPDVRAALAGLVDGCDARRTLVFTCGPEPLKWACAAAAAEAGASFHAETFEL
jgi:NAD(P)H-flavin reductase